MSSEPASRRDEPIEKHEAHTSSQVSPKSVEKKEWVTPTVVVEKFSRTSLNQIQSFPDGGGQFDFGSGGF